MDKATIIRELEDLYPGRRIIENKDTKGDTVEIICEIEPTHEHSNYSIAIAVVGTIQKHVHQKSIEEYEVLRGSLLLIKDQQTYFLNEGDKITILPDEIHEGSGDTVWIKTTSRLGWTHGDHILL